MAEDFGKRLQRLRHDRGLSRYAVFKATGLSQQLLLQLERYKSGAKVQAGHLHRLARFYGVTIEYLLGPDDDEDAHAA